MQLSVFDFFLQFYSFFSQDVVVGLITSFIAALIMTVFRRKPVVPQDDADLVGSGGESLLTIANLFWGVMKFLAVILGVIGGGISVGVWLGILPPVLGA